MKNMKNNCRGKTGVRWTIVGASMLLALLGIGLGNGHAQEQDVIEAGKREFQRSCATCHGVDAKGDGPSAIVLNVKPSDLTQMKKRHGGVFLFWRTYEKISGRDEEVIRGHGTREMPIWGERFHLERGSSEEYQSGVRGRILSLVYYLQSIQVP
jgi:mono/diheme cytochrome c family protein